MPDLPPINFFDPWYRVIHLPLIFIFGACMGSFFNVCIYRIPRGMSLSRPGSHCYRCGQPVRWYNNLPLFSYWILRGRCRECGVEFSPRYFAVELLTAFLFLLAYLRLGPTLNLIPALLLISLLVIATFTDLDHWIIPDRVSLGGLVLGLILAGVWSLAIYLGMSPYQLNENPLMAPWGLPMPLVPLVNSAAGALGGFVVMWGIGAIGSVIFRKEAMGWGDIKLFAMFGAFCGLEYLIYILVMSCIFGTVAGLVSLILSRRARRLPAPAALAPLSPLAPEVAFSGPLMQSYLLNEDEQATVLRALTRPGVVGAARHHLPFGPSLALAAIIVFLYGPQIRAWVEHLMFGDMLLWE